MDITRIITCFQVTFAPTGNIKFREEYSDPHDFYQQFTELETGTILYHFKGHQQPNDTEGVMLGDVITTDNCVTSHFGDTRLFFQHQYLEEDVELMPEWTDDYSQKCTSIC